MPVTRLLTTTEAAAELGVTAETVRRWARDGRLRHTVTPTKRMLFAPADLADVYRIVEPSEQAS